MGFTRLRSAKGSKFHAATVADTVSIKRHASTYHHPKEFQQCAREADIFVIAFRDDYWFSIHTCAGCTKACCAALFSSLSKWWSNVSRLSPPEFMSELLHTRNPATSTYVQGPDKRWNPKPWNI
eukprot:1853069-Amphidinium_carterae.2